MHAEHRGDFYHFYARDFENRPIPSHRDVDRAVRLLRNLLFDIEDQGQDELALFQIENDEIAAKIQVFIREVELENMPNVVRIYKHWLYFGHTHAQFANILIVLDDNQPPGPA